MSVAAASAAGSRKTLEDDDEGGEDDVDRARRERRRGRGRGREALRSARGVKATTWAVRPAARRAEIGSFMPKRDRLRQVDLSGVVGAPT